MNYLINTNNITIVLIFSTLLMFTVILLLAIRKLLQKIFNKIDNIKLDKSLPYIEEFLKNSNTKLIDSIYKSKSVMNYLINYLDKFKGTETNRIHDLYIKLGFFKNDKKLIKSHSYFKRLTALKRISKTKIKLSEKEYQSLLNDKFIDVRWQAMEILIEQQKKHSLNDLVKFVSLKENIVHKGIILNLLELYSTYDVDGLVFMLEHSSSEKFTEFALKIIETTTNVPENVVLDNINVQSNKETLISALKILSNVPSERFYLFINDILRVYNDDEIKIVIANSLSNLQSDTAYDILEKLSNDTNHNVRIHACDSLISMNTQSSNNYIKNIFQNIKHPSHIIMKNQLKLRTFYGS